MPGLYAGGGLIQVTRVVPEPTQMVNVFTTSSSRMGFAAA